MRKFTIFYLVDDAFEWNKKRILNEFPEIVIRPVNIHDPQFDFIREYYSSGHQALFFDYLRAYISKECAPFLWLDTDIIVKNSLDPLEKILQDVNPAIAMAPDFRIEDNSVNDFHFRMLEFYKIMDSVAFQRDHPISERYPVKYNCGVLYINNPIEREWKEVFLKVSHLFPEYEDSILPPEVYGKGAVSTFGQGIWNLLFWNLDGLELDGKWNTLKFQDPNKNGCIIHYAVDKVQLFEDAQKDKVD